MKTLIGILSAIVIIVIAVFTFFMVNSRFGDFILYGGNIYDWSPRTIPPALDFPAQRSPSICITPDENPVNIRSGGGLQYSVVGLLGFGKKLPLMGQYNGWYEVTDNQWVSGQVTHIIDCNPSKENVRCLTTTVVGHLSIVQNDPPLDSQMISRVFDYMEKVVPPIETAPAKYPPYLIFTDDYTWMEDLTYNGNFSGVTTGVHWDGCQFTKSSPNVVLMIVLNRKDVPTQYKFGIMVHEMCHYFGGIHGAAAAPYGQADWGFEKVYAPADCSSWENFFNLAPHLADMAWLNQCQRDPLCLGLRHAIVGT